MATTRATYLNCVGNNLDTETTRGPGEPDIIIWEVNRPVDIHQTCADNLGGASTQGW